MDDSGTYSKRGELDPIYNPLLSVFGRRVEGTTYYELLITGLFNFLQSADDFDLEKPEVIFELAGFTLPATEACEEFEVSTRTRIVDPSTSDEW